MRHRFRPVPHLKRKKQNDTFAENSLKTRWDSPLRICSEPFAAAAFFRLFVLLTGRCEWTNAPKPGASAAAVAGVLVGQCRRSAIGRAAAGKTNCTENSSFDWRLRDGGHAPAAAQQFRPAQGHGRERFGFAVFSAVNRLCLPFRRWLFYTLQDGRKGGDASPAARAAQIAQVQNRRLSEIRTINQRIKND